MARGAEIVEKHITILRDVPNAQDWKVSAGPEDLGELVADVRRLESMLGHGRKEPAQVEEGAQIWATKSVVAVHDLVAGTVLTAPDLITKRPGGGIPASQLDAVIGRTLARPVAADTGLRMDDLV